MSLTQQQYDDAIAWAAVAPQPVPTLPEYAQLTGAIGALRPALPVVHNYPINIAALVMLDAQYQSDRYERFQHHWCVTKDTATTSFRKTNLAAGGASVALAYPAYRLMVSPIRSDDTVGVAVERARSAVVAGASRGAFSIACGPEDGCPVMGQIQALDAAGAPVADPSESFPPFIFWLDRNGTAKDFPLAVAQNGTFDWTHPGPGPLSYNVEMATPAAMQWVAFPKAWADDPRAYPLTPRVPIQATGPAPLDLVRVNLATTHDTMGMNLFIPRKTRRGITVCEGIQGYFWGELIRPTQFQPTDLLDGPVGTPLAYVLNAWVSHRPGDVARKIYGGDNARVFKIAADGTITTLFGLRNKNNQPQYQTDYASIYNEPRTLADYDVVGDWDPSIPVAERFPWESWFSLFDPSTTTLDAAAAAVTDNVTPAPGEQPHVAPGPVMIASDTRHNRILRAGFNFKDHAIPAKVSVLATASDPWGGALYGDGFIFAERGANRLQVMRFDGTRESVLSEDANGARWGAVNQQSRTFQFAPSIYNYADFISGKLAYMVRQGCDCTAPEGVAVMDDWVYYAGYAMGGVRRINDKTGEVQLCCLPFMSWGIQSHFINIAVADGTVPGIPRHAIATTTFAINELGMPALFVPQAGVSSFGEPLTHALKVPLLSAYGYETSQGPHYFGGIYPTAVGIGHGMVLFGGTQFGLGALMQRDPALDLPAPDPKRMMIAGQKWRVRGEYLLRGRFGYNRYNKLPLPWGEDADIDYFLVNNGHVKP